MSVDELIQILQKMAKDNYYVCFINGENGQMPVNSVTIEDDYWYGDNRKVIVLNYINVKHSIIIREVPT